MNTDRMSCGEAREKLPLYVGGDLDGAMLEAVRGHVESCAECGARAAFAGNARHELVAALRAREADVSAPGLWPGIRSALRAEGLVPPQIPARSLPLARGRSSRWTWAFVPAAAAAVVLVLVQLGGGFSAGSGKTGSGKTGSEKTGSEKNSAGVKSLGVPAGGPEVASTTLPVHVPIVPVSTAGGLERVDPHLPTQLPAPFRRPARVGERPVTSAGDISLSGFK